MKWNKWFRLYVGIVGILFGYLKFQGDPNSPFICCLGLGFIASLLLPGAVVSYLAVGQLSLGIAFGASAVFWAIVASICNRKPKPPARPQGEVSRPGTITLAYGHRRRTRWEVR